MSNAGRDPDIDRFRQGFYTLAVLVGGTVLAVLYFNFRGYLLPNPTRKTGQALAIHEITRAGGSVQVDYRIPDLPVVRVDFEGPARDQVLGDNGLGRMRPHLEGLPRLRYLRITSSTRISDAGLKHLEGLTQLKTIELHGDKLTDFGVNRLRKNLPNVQIHFSSGQLPMRE